VVSEAVLTFGVAIIKIASAKRLEQGCRGSVKAKTDHRQIGIAHRILDRKEDERKTMDY
jgi:hypothetical protein